MAEKDDLSSSAAKSAEQMMADEKAAMRARKRSQKPKVEYIGEYTVVAGDTMGGIALQYYGSALEDKWMAIYEANKDVISNPDRIKPGIKLQIPME